MVARVHRVTIFFIPSIMILTTRITTIFILLFIAGVSWSQETTKGDFLILPGSKLSILGKSNVNNFTCVCRENFIAQPYLVNMPLAGNAITFTQTFIKLPVALFDCGNKMMNKDFYNALKGEKHPNIKILLEYISFVKKSDTTPPTKTGDARVMIYLAGVTRTVQMPVYIRQTALHTWHIKSAKPLRMTDFHIVPPRAMMGMIRTENEITIQLDLFIEIQPQLSDNILKQ